MEVLTKKRSDPINWRVQTYGVVVLLGVVAILLIVYVWVAPVVRARASNVSPPKAPALSHPGKELQPVDPALQALEDRQVRLADQMAAQEKVLNTEKEEISSFDESAKLLMTVAGLFAIVLAAGSWKALDEQRKASSDNLDLQRQKSDLQFQGSMEDSQRSLKAVEKLRDEVQRDFPMFGRMRSNFFQILQGLEIACSKLQLDDETYKNLRWDEEQRILFYENAISTSLLLDTAEYAKQLSEIYRLLGDFYGSKFYLEFKEKGDAADKKDFYRSRFYFDRSIDYDPSNYLAYIHAGYFSQYYGKKEFACISRSYFERAAAVGKDYQRPFLSIALIELEGFEDDQAALSALDQAAKRGKYDQGIDAPDDGQVRYLEACAQCRIAQGLDGQPREDLLRKAFALLKASLKSPSDKVLRMFALDKDTYFEIFATSPMFGEEFDGIVRSVRSPIS